MTWIARSSKDNDAEVGCRDFWKLLFLNECSNRCFTDIARSNAVGKAREAGCLQVSNTSFKEVREVAVCASKQLGPVIPSELQVRRTDGGAAPN
jgi:hypothetical protein